MERHYEGELLEEIKMWVSITYFINHVNNSIIFVYLNKNNVSF